MTSETTTYEIMQADGNPDAEFYGTPSGDWYMIPDSAFATEEEALAAIDELHAMRDWADAILAVKSSSERYISRIVYP